MKTICVIAVDNSEPDDRVAFYRIEGEDPEQIHKCPEIRIPTGRKRIDHHSADKYIPEQLRIRLGMKLVAMGFAIDLTDTELEELLNVSS